MLDIKLIRTHPEVVRQNLTRRQNPQYLEWFEELLRVDEEWRKCVRRVEGLRRQKNQLTLQIAEAKHKQESCEELMDAVKQLKGELEQLESKVLNLAARRQELLLRIPNLLHESVPYGRDESENVVTKYLGKPPRFEFEPKGHLEILQSLGLIDVQRGAKVAGHTFYYLKNELVLLDFAIMQFAMNKLLRKGYTLLEPPFMLKRDAYIGATDLAFFQDQLYKLEGEDLYLIATAEHPVAAMFKDEVLNAEDLPLRIVAVSPCFRKEVGAHGKYTKGLFRMHHFNKVEQFAFCLPEQSWELFEELQSNAEQLYQELGLYCRVVNVCTGDIGEFAAKKYDIEVWMADGKFREAGSNSNCTDYQARRLSVRYREREGRPPKGFVHTLNNTALATSRTMIAIVEQFQRADGTVKIPRALWKFVGVKELA